MSKPRIVTRLAPAFAAFLVVGLVAPVTACSNNGDDSTTTEMAQMSKDEFLAYLVAEELTLEEAVVLIEDAGYEWRVASIDGVLQPTTRDYREDRVTMEIDNGVVVAARWE